MATNYTKNYNLCQWEPDDKVLREEFNADNAKIDAALRTHATQITQALSASGAAYSPDKPPVAIGSYAGDNAATRIINVGFRPRAVLLVETQLYWRSGALPVTWYSGAVVDGDPAAWTSWTALMITDNGFQVGYVKALQGENHNAFICTNGTGYKYVYFAFR